MKKLLLLLGICITFCACEKDLIVNKAIVLQIDNYVIRYESTEKLVLDARLQTEPTTKARISIGFEGTVIYYAPEFGLNLNSEKFLEIAARNGDIGYKLERAWYPGNFGEPFAYAENFSGIEVVCTNAAWDESHPAGSSLNDLLEATFESYYNFVHSGYDREKEKEIWRNCKPLSQLTMTDLCMLKNKIHLYFDSRPDSGTYDFKVTLTTVDGVKRSGTCTVVF